MALPFIDLDTVGFEESGYLWLLLAPAALAILWIWRAMTRRRDVSTLHRRRYLPVRERFGVLGDLLFWFSVVLATACVILALARPFARASLLRTAGIDLVVLLDGSASMRVDDVIGDRWQRSIRFLRSLGESLRWQDDRLALALFANIATPQVRLTKDPNTLFFFLDHLYAEPPFRLRDDTTWDTNIERGIYWGLRVVEKDEELNGESPNAKAFVLISDGQAWSGEVQSALSLTAERGIPVFVVGVGTTVGGFIPEPPRFTFRYLGAPPRETEYVPILSVLDRPSLEVIAAAGGGRYFELDRGSDRAIAATIIEEARRRAGPRGVEEAREGLYWRFLQAAAGFLILGALFLRERTELWLQVAGTVGVLLLVTSLTR